MTHDEAVDILESIKALYPRYQMSKKKARFLIPQLKQMDYQRVIDRLSAYVAEHPFAPTISDIAAYPPEQNTHLQQISQWRKEAAQVSEETKLEFQIQMEKLAKECNIP